MHPYHQAVHHTNCHQRGLPYICMWPFTDDNWNNLPHIIITSPKEWNPSSLDSKDTEEWYQKQTQELELLHQGILTELGDLKPNLEDNEDEDHLDRTQLAVDRGGIKVYLTQTIVDDLSEGFIACKANGEREPINYIPEQHDEYFSHGHISTYLVQSQSSKGREKSPMEAATWIRCRTTLQEHMSEQHPSLYRQFHSNMKSIWSTSLVQTWKASKAHFRPQLSLGQGGW